MLNGVKVMFDNGVFEATKRPLFIPKRLDPDCYPFISP